MSIRVGRPFADGQTSTAWSGKWRGNNSRHEVAVPATWREDVLARELAIVDERLVLFVLPMRGGGDGVDLFDAVVVEPARGVSIRAARVVIARAGAVGGVAVRASTKRGAITRLRKAVAGVEV